MHKCCVLERQEASLPLHQHKPPNIRSFCGQEGKASKSVCFKSYTKSTGFVDLSDMMANSHSISDKNWSGLKSLHPPT
jgi:hypothetical protein